MPRQTEMLGRTSTRDACVGRVPVPGRTTACVKDGEPMLLLLYVILPEAAYCTSWRTLG